MTVIGIVVVIILVISGVTIFGGHMIKTAVNHGGPALLGVPVKLEHAAFSPLAGKMRLRNLHIGNPEGFNTPALFELGEVELRDIGKEGGGVSAADAIRIVFSVIAGNVQNAVFGAGDFLMSGVGAIGDGAASVGDAAGDGAAAVAGAVGDGTAAAVQSISGLLGGDAEDDEPAKPELSTQ